VCLQVSTRGRSWVQPRGLEAELQDMTEQVEYAIKSAMGCDWFLSLESSRKAARKRGEVRGALNLSRSAKAARKIRLRLSPTVPPGYSWPWVYHYQR